MPRYIDLEEFSKRINENIKPENLEEKALIEWCKDECIRQGYAMPISDVVPRAEIERIFEDIERITAAAYNYFMFDREGVGMNATLVVEFSDEIDREIAELKKKYMEGKGGVIMEDKEIIKALECCKKDDCDNCPNDFGNCYANLAGDALDLINRQKAEIIETRRDLLNEIYTLEHQLEVVKAEAIKEVAERAKEHFGTYTDVEESNAVYVKNLINDIVKEMTEQVLVQLAQNNIEK